MGEGTIIHGVFKEGKNVGNIVNRGVSKENPDVIKQLRKDGKHNDGPTGQASDNHFGEHEKKDPSTNEAQPKTLLGRWQKKYDDYRTDQVNKTLANKDKIDNYVEAKKLKEKMHEAQLRPLKKFANTKIGKLMIWGTLGSCLLTGNLAVPMAVLHGMGSILGSAAGGLAANPMRAFGLAGLAGGLGSALLKPVENANKSLASADKMAVDASAKSPFGASKHAIENAEATGAQNTLDEQQGKTVQNQANAYVDKSKDDDLSK